MQIRRLPTSDYSVYHLTTWPTQMNCNCIQMSSSGKFQRRWQHLTCCVSDCVSFVVGKPRRLNSNDAHSRFIQGYSDWTTTSYQVDYLSGLVPCFILVSAEYRLYDFDVVECLTAIASLSMNERVAQCFHQLLDRPNSNNDWWVV